MSTQIRFCNRLNVIPCVDTKSQCNKELCWSKYFLKRWILKIKSKWTTERSFRFVLFCLRPLKTCHVNIRNKREKNLSNCQHLFHLPLNGVLINVFYFVKKIYYKCVDQAIVTSQYFLQKLIDLKSYSWKIHAQLLNDFHNFWVIFINWSSIVLCTLNIQTTAS